MADGEEMQGALTLPIYRVASLPGRGGVNPYIDLFYDALRPAGVECVAEPTTSRAWLESSAGRVEALHFHWPESIWRPSGGGPRGPWSTALRRSVPGLWRLDDMLKPLYAKPALAAYRVRRAKSALLQDFVGFLDCAKSANLRIIWTVHNVEAHEAWDDADRRGFNALARRADLAIFHSDSARHAALSRYNFRGECVVMPHGNYVGIYPAARPREEVARQYGLDPARNIVSCVGAIRPYKGLELAIEAVLSLPDLQLLCAGDCWDDGYFSLLQRQAEGCSRIKFVRRALSPQEFSNCIGVGAAVLLPYKKITGSGALLAALSLGRTVIASDLSYFRELLDCHPGVGRLVAAGDAAAWARAIQLHLSEGHLEEGNRAALDAARRYDWNAVVRPVVTAIEGFR